MYISFSKIRQTLSEISPKDMATTILGLSIKMTAATLQSFGLLCFAKTSVEMEIKFSGKDFTYFTDHKGLLITTGLAATIGSLLIYEMGECLIQPHKAIVVKPTILASMGRQAGSRGKLLKVNKLY